MGKCVESYRNSLWCANASNSELSHRSRNRKNEIEGGVPLPYQYTDELVSVSKSGVSWHITNTTHMRNKCVSFNCLQGTVLLHRALQITEWTSFDWFFTCKNKMITPIVAAQSFILASCFSTLSLLVFKHVDQRKNIKLARTLSRHTSMSDLANKVQWWSGTRFFARQCDITIGILIRKIQRTKDNIDYENCVMAWCSTFIPSGTYRCNVLIQLE